ncbi:MAG: endonuclease/exonuclease/phosphatase family protein [Acidobacteria bacterium]|nr:endonuclease/exonuclease/phosphatase family protein [Acidobacteriota bacterium]
MLCLILMICAALAVARARFADKQQCVADSKDAARLFESGGFAKEPAANAATPVEIKIVSYNMRWRGGKELDAITKLLRDDTHLGGADVVGLQEADRNRKRSGSVNAARKMAQDLGWNYVWAAPPSDATKQGDREAGEDETGVAILSPHALTDVTRIVLPNPGANCRRRAAVGATVRVGKESVRVYSVHGETRLDVEKKIEQWQAILADTKSHPSARRVVVLGDFNTIMSKDVKAARKVFTDAGFSTPFSDDDITWESFIVGLKLDWVWLRGLDAASHGIATGVTYSDHYPLWLTARL